MIIDFTEITDSHEFENFAQKFLEYQGNNIKSIPAIGADGGRDIICEESSLYGGGYRWLVSCKHYAKSNKSVGVSDDKADANKLIQHNCQGFMFVYSTALTEGLKTSVEQVCTHSANSPKYQFFTPWEIQDVMVNNPYFYPLLMQYFPISHQRLVGCINTTPTCCPNGGASGQDIFAVYIRDNKTQKIVPTVLGECCINSYTEHLNEISAAYGVAVIHRV